ncbi:hypothetical protein ASPZODRAFT_64812 [Penicilliopsis zonata CBS 506.65]|uniref:Uncharacterized protein n=1 Tax=Penicilliopsis zonata CBS 506.65 TaxID=1073090 RepID=A0A1L9SJM9_9EURO|nr:hypothetical protein ASPZODRAFT_64812 [Penicilliopsis zonata CBS 506.65]OJJ47398.1 hypothetical protein ASPZODRAFT_64812 [Penicilliopsis zonata CBS 506.65]
MDTVPEEIPRLEQLTDESEEEILKENCFWLQTYKELIQSSPAYQKFLGDLRRESVLTRAKPDIFEDLYHGIYKKLPVSKEISRKVRPERSNMTYLLDWDLWCFLDELPCSGSLDIAIENTVVLVGSSTTAQMLRCTEYLQMMWPSSGLAVFNLIQKLVQDTGTPVQSDTIPDDTRIEADYLSDSRQLRVRVDGLPSWIVEIGQMLAWIGAALQVSPFRNRFVFYRPILPTHPSLPQEPQCRIKFVSNREGGGPLRKGQCWHGLFRNPVVVEGFPVARRIGASLPGLEISLSMMAALLETRHVHSFADTLFIKGFDTLLVATQSENGFMMWHLLPSTDGNRISYNEGVSLSCSSIQMADLGDSRHILGWSSEIEFLAGTHQASYDVKTSNLPRASANGLLADTSISLGRIVTGGRALSVDEKLSKVRHNYIRKLKWIEKQYVLLWDEEDKRGWLVNGTSALLHLVRAALELDRKGAFASATLFDPAEMVYPSPYGPGSASRVLVDPSNMQLPIHEGDDSPVPFQNHVVQFYELLEKIFDYESAAVNRHPERSRSRARLEGWDFENLAAGRDPVLARESRLDVSGRSWVDLVRSMRAITLFGRGFGEIIRSFDVCSQWVTMPTERSCLAVSHQDLKEIVASWCGNLSSCPPTLTDLIAWHIPTDGATTCRCATNKDRQHSDIVQVLLPSSMSSRLSSQGLQADAVHDGAFIFGQNSENTWYWPETGEPSKQPIIQEPVARKSDNGSPFYDSGIGDSRDSSTSALHDETNQYPERSPQTSQPQYTTSDYTVGIICALHFELKAVRMLFNSYHDNVRVSSTDLNAYVFGRMGMHNIVATCLPDGEYGISAAASVASNVKRTFSRLQFCLLVGIGGGVPSLRHDIRLGDVVVSKPIGSNVGVLQYDMVKTLADGETQMNGYLQPPPRFLGSMSSLMQSDPRLSRTPLEPYLRQIREVGGQEYAYPGALLDVLYVPDYPHVRDESTCAKCDLSKVQIRPSRPSHQPYIHYGLIASGNQVMKDARTRDEIAARHDVLCFEMEAAGIMNVLPSFIIRGVCDYSDSHKNKQWQKYAAATAAAFAKLLLSHVRPDVESEYDYRLSPGLDLGDHEHPVKRRRIVH